MFYVNARGTEATATALTRDMITINSPEALLKLFPINTRAVLLKLIFLVTGSAIPRPRDAKATAEKAFTLIDMKFGNGAKEAKAPKKAVKPVKASPVSVPDKTPEPVRKTPARSTAKVVKTKTVAAVTKQDTEVRSTVKKVSNPALEKPPVKLTPLAEKMSTTKHGEKRIRDLYALHPAGLKSPRARDGEQYKIIRACVRKAVENGVMFITRQDIIDMAEAQGIQVTGKMTIAKVLSYYLRDLKAEGLISQGGENDGRKKKVVAK